MPRGPGDSKPANTIQAKPLTQSMRRAPRRHDVLPQTRLRTVRRGQVAAAERHHRPRETADADPGLPDRANELVERLTLRISPPSNQHADRHGDHSSRRRAAAKKDTEVQRSGGFAVVSDGVARRYCRCSPRRGTRRPRRGCAQFIIDRPENCAFTTQA
jgi:hypothetical protein